MKKLAALLILFGSGLAAYGVSAFSGEFRTNTRFDPAQLEGEINWTTQDRVEIVTGIVLLAGGLMLRKG